MHRASDAGLNGDKRVMIRTAEPADVEMLFEIRTSVIENYQSREELAALGVTPESIAGMLSGSCRAWIAEVGGKDAAFAMADADQGTVFAMFVRPAFEGCGLGRLLMDEAERWLFDRGWDEIWLLTGSEPNLRAVGFYLHRGWMAVGEEPDGQTKYVKRRT